jgi:UDP-glucuronate 4-epimerase
MSLRILVTGAAGFIGAHTLQALQRRFPDATLLGLDIFNAYYDPALKHARVAALCPQVAMTSLDIADTAALLNYFADHQPTHVVHLAAQAGVRHSIEQPFDYLHANLSGFLNLLEAIRKYPATHTVFASTSSIYGKQTHTPFVESMPIQTPISLYSATKGANELMAHAYAHLYGLRLTALRFFTVFGAWGRPDMAPILFARAILKGEPIQVFNGGDMLRDFTHVSDIVDGVIASLMAPARDPFAAYNLGAGRPVELNRFIALIEQAAGKSAKRVSKGMQAGDMQATYADTTLAAQDFGYAPHKPLDEAVTELVNWANAYYAVEQAQSR